MVVGECFTPDIPLYAGVCGSVTERVGVTSLTIRGAGRVGVTSLVIRRE
jgi:hypothetical protein